MTKIFLQRFLSMTGVLAASVTLLSSCAGPTPGTNGQPATVDNPVPLHATNSEQVDIQNRTPDTDARKRARLRMELAVSYYQDGKFSVALDELKQALVLDPNFADAYGVLALVYMELQEKTLADQSFQRALALDPNSSDLNNNYGWFLCQTGHEAQSIQLFNAALKNPLYGQPARPLQNAGVCALKLGDKNAAFDYFRRSFELDPTGVVAPYNLAVIYFERKDLERAEFYSSIVNKTVSANAPSLWLGVRIAHALGHQSEELSLSAQLQRGFPDSREAQLSIRHAYNE